MHNKSWIHKYICRLMKMMGFKCKQIVYNGHGRQGCILSFTCKRLLSSSSTTPCLKREDFQYILHHSSFSPWKVTTLSLSTHTHIFFLDYLANVEVLLISYLICLITWWMVKTLSKINWFKRVTVFMKSTLKIPSYFCGVSFLTMTGSFSSKKNDILPLTKYLRYFSFIF